MLCLLFKNVWLLDTFFWILSRSFSEACFSFEWSGSFSACFTISCVVYSVFCILYSCLKRVISFVNNQSVSIIIGRSWKTNFTLILFSLAGRIPFSNFPNRRVGHVAPSLIMHVRASQHLHVRAAPVLPAHWLLASLPLN